MSWQLALTLASICVGLLVLILMQIEKPRSLRTYRPTADNRWQHRDEFRVFMRDCK